MKKSTTGSRVPSVIEPTETKMVFVENLPKPKKWWQEYSALLIALLALVVSIYSAYLSRREFVAAHRPYVYVICRQATKNNVTSMDVRTILLGCLNAPARIIKQEASYVVRKRDENGKGQVGRIIPVPLSSAPSILYPSEEPRTQITILYDFEKEIGTDPEVKLRRTVRIVYQELSTKRTYYVEGNWEYNSDYKV
jgi:hypothetical protein